MSKDNEPLISTYGKRENAPAAAEFNRGATTVQEVQDAIDKRNASTNATSPRRYGER